MTECSCGEPIDPRRIALGYKCCLSCGEKQAKQRRFTIVPMHKSNYIPVFNKELLQGINNKTLRG